MQMEVSAHVLRPSCRGPVPIASHHLTDPAGETRPHMLQSSSCDQSPQHYPLSTSLPLTQQAVMSQESQTLELTPLSCSFLLAQLHLPTTAKVTSLCCSLAPLTQSELLCRQGLLF